MMMRYIRLYENFTVSTSSPDIKNDIIDMFIDLVEDGFILDIFNNHEYKKCTLSITLDNENEFDSSIVKDRILTAIDYINEYYTIINSNNRFVIFNEYSDRSISGNLYSANNSNYYDIYPDNKEVKSIGIEIDYYNEEKDLDKNLSFHYSSI